MEKISIIIPCYNAAKCLSRPLNSIREQDYKDLEIIIVNDGSTDNTVEVASKLAMLDNRIRIVNQKNGGVSAARNNGLAHATSDYIMYLDADDNYTTPFAISTMMNRLLETGSDMCVCNFTHPCFEQYMSEGVYDMTDKNQFLTFYQDFFAHGMPWNKIQKRSCLTEDFVLGVKFNEDELYNLDNLHNVKKIVVVDKVLHNYYCEPTVPKKGESSAVNSIYAVDKFWEKKSTIWHMGMKNYNYRVQSIAKFHPELMEDMHYIRCFDFFFWDFYLMAKNNVPEEYVTETCKGIFAEQLFINTIKDKERYGIRLKEDYQNNVELFVKLAYEAYRDIKVGNKRLSMTKVFSALFGKLFYDLTDETNRIDLLVDSYLAFYENITPESLFLNKMLQKKHIQNMEPDYKVILFSKNIKKKAAKAN